MRKFILILSIFFFFNFLTESNSMSINNKIETKEIDKTFKLNPNAIISVNTDLGNISIEAYEKNEVKVKLTIEGNQEWIDDIEFNYKHQADKLLLEVLNKNHNRDNNNHHRNIQLSVLIPENIFYNLELNTNAGNLNINKFKKAGINLNTNAGNINLTNLKCDVKGETNAGNLNIENSSGNYELKTNAGNFNVRKSSGKITGYLNAGKFNVELPDDFKGLDLVATTGNVSIKIPSSLNAEIDFEQTGFGKIEFIPDNFSSKVNLQLEKMSSNHLKGKINGGGNLIKVVNNTGNIELELL